MQLRMSALGQKQTCATQKPMSAKGQKRTCRDVCYGPIPDMHLNSDNRNGGSIEVDTQPGEFTEIRVILPRVSAFV